MADVVMFTGGEDVTPRLYGEKVGKYTSCNPVRDEKEATAFLVCQDLGIPVLGICRGAQFLNVQSGGKMVQHVSGHGAPHEVLTNKNMTVVLSSTHHQMMNPFLLDEKDYTLIGWSEGISDTYLNGENEDNHLFMMERIEPEILYYPKTKALCIQAHPEIMNPNSKGVEFCRSLVKEYLL